MSKRQYCGATGCAEKCLTAGNGYACVAIGSIGVIAYSFYKVAGGMEAILASGIDIYIVLLPFAILVVLTLVSIFLSKFERFENWYTAVLFGASIPSLYLAICASNSVR